MEKDGLSTYDEVGVDPDVELERYMFTAQEYEQIAQKLDSEGEEAAREFGDLLLREKDQGLDNNG